MSAIVEHNLDFALGILLKAKNIRFCLMEEGEELAEPIEYIPYIRTCKDLDSADRVLSAIVDDLVQKEVRTIAAKSIQLVKRDDGMLEISFNPAVLKKGYAGNGTWDIRHTIEPTVSVTMEDNGPSLSGDVADKLKFAKRTILHVIVGDDTYLPTKADIEHLQEAFSNVHITGGVVVTQTGVTCKLVDLQESEGVKVLSVKTHQDDENCHDID